MRIIKEAFRVLLGSVRAPNRGRAFYATIITVQTLGIGAAVVTSSIVQTSLFRPLGVEDENRLVIVESSGGSTDNSISPPDYDHWRERTHAFEQLATYVWSSAALVGGGQPARLRIADVTSNWFAALKVPLTLGRGFLKSEEGLGAPHVLVLSHHLWSSQFNSDPHLLGNRVFLDGVPYAVVGISSRDFTFPDGADAWRPIALPAGSSNCVDCPFFFGPIGRLRPTATINDVQREASELASLIHRRHSDLRPSYRVSSLREYVVGEAKLPMRVLTMAVTCILLLMCANVSSLYAVRIAHRAPEIAVRLALGSTLRRIQLTIFLEALLTAAFAGVIAAVLGTLVVDILSPLIWQGPSVAASASHQMLWLSSLVVSAVVGIVAAISPVAAAGGLADSGHFNDALRARGHGRLARRIRRFSLYAQLAMLVPLLTSALLIALSYENLVDTPLGFSADHVVRADIALPQCGTTWVPKDSCPEAQGTHYSSDTMISAFAAELQHQIESTPNVESAAIGIGVPFTRWAAHEIDLDGTGKIVAKARSVTPEYFHTLRIPLLRGRHFTAADGGRGARVVIVNSAFTRKYLADPHAVGTTLLNAYNIVGVVGDTRDIRVSAAADPVIYFPFNASPSPWFTVIAKTRGDPKSIESFIRARTHQIDPSVPLFDVAPLSEAIRRTLGPQRLIAAAVAWFCAFGVMLGMIGAYSLVALSARARERELAIRIAIGATALRVVRTITGEVTTLACFALLSGLVLAAAFAFLLGRTLYEITPMNVGVFASASAAFAFTIGSASLLAARRAVRTPVTSALRAD